MFNLTTERNFFIDRPLDDSGLKLKEGATLLSADMKRELRRQQWEKEAEEAADGPVHYSNVQFDGEFILVGRKRYCTSLYCLFSCCQFLSFCFDF